LAGKDKVGVPGATARLSVTLAAWLPLSVTWNVRPLNVPAAVGVPANWPLLDPIPLGSEPAVCVHA
jgi:hypothetical protein